MKQIFIVSLVIFEEYSFVLLKYFPLLYLRQRKKFEIEFEKLNLTLPIKNLLATALLFT